MSILDRSALGRGGGTRPVWSADPVDDRQLVVEPERQPRTRATGLSGPDWCR